MKINLLFPLLFVMSALFLSCNSEEDPEEHVTIDDPYNKSIVDIDVRGNSVYVASAKDGFYIYENEAWSVMKEEDGLLSNSLTSIAVSADGIVYAGTSLGISTFNNGKWSKITTAEGLYSDNVKTLTFDPNGDLWIGTGNNRLIRYNGIEITATYHVNSEVSGPGQMGHIHTVCFDKNGNVWAGSCISGLSVFDGVQWTDNINNLNVFVQASVCANNGEIWIGHISGAYQLVSENWIKHDVGNGLANNMVLDFAVDGDDNVWAATEGGLSRFDGTQWHNFTTEDGLPDNYVGAVACDQDNNIIWVGTSKGLTQLNLD